MVSISIRIINIQGKARAFQMTIMDLLYDRMIVFVVCRTMPRYGTAAIAALAAVRAW